MLQTDNGTLCACAVQCRRPVLEVRTGNADNPDQGHCECKHEHGEYKYEPDNSDIVVTIAESAFGGLFRSKRVFFNDRA